MNTKPYAVVELKTNTIVRRFAGLRAAVDCADRKGAGFKQGFIYEDGRVLGFSGQGAGVEIARVAA
jgi:hypothetical protein